MQSPILIVPIDALWTQPPKAALQQMHKPRILPTEAPKHVVP